MRAPAPGDGHSTPAKPGRAELNPCAASHSIQRERRGPPYGGAPLPPGRAGLTAEAVHWTALIAASKRLAKEPPFRLFIQAGLRAVPTSVRTKAMWDLGPRPNYLVGVLAAAEQARRENVSAMSVIEFGVAGGNGLVALQHWAAQVEREIGVEIAVFGFDTGSGLPDPCGDHRDHPDKWVPGDYPVDVEALQSRLTSRTKLIIGHTRDTVPNFAENVLSSPIGFASIDLDLYSSTKPALALLSGPNRRVLQKTYLYFDDVADPKATFFHRFAGELLAIDEFNNSNSEVKIDVWRGLRSGRIFQDNDWIEKMYIAHDLEAISRAHVERKPLQDFRLRRRSTAVSSRP